MRLKTKKVPEECCGDVDISFYNVDISFYKGGHEDTNKGAIGKIILHKNTKKIDWFTCRESFHDRFPNAKCILFWTTAIESVVAFIKQAETILKLPRKYRTKFYYTNNEDVLYCQVGSWWAGSRVRLNLFTILLRAGQRYNPKRSFWTCAESHPYISATKNAFRHFMQGNTTYNCPVRHKAFPGWVDAFYHIGSERLKERLVKVANRKRKKICST